MGVKEKVKDSVESIADACYANPQNVTAMAAGSATAIILDQIGFSPFVCLCGGAASATAAVIVHSGIAVHCNKDDFKNLLPAKEHKKDLERKIREFEDSWEGKSRGFLVKAKDTILEYPKTTAALLSIALFNENIPYEFLDFPLQIYNMLPHGQGISGMTKGLVEMYNSGRLDRMIWGYYAKLIPIETGFFLLGYSGAKTLRNMFHSAFYRKMRHLFRGRQAEIMHRYDKAVEEYKEANKFGGNYHRMIANIYMKDGNAMDLALRELSEAARKKSRSYGIGESFIKMTSLNIKRKLRRAIRRKPGEMGNWLQLAYHHYGLFDVGKSLKMMEDAERQFPGDPRIRFLHGEMLESNSMKEEAMVKYREAGTLLLQNADISKEFSLVGDFRNELLVHRFDRYIQSLIAIKRNSRTERLKTEKQQIQALKPYFGRRISDFLCDFELGKFYHLLLRYIGGKNIHQLISEGHYGQNRDPGLLADLKECVALLKDIENIGMWAFRDNKISLRDPLSESRGYFPERIANALELLAESGVLLAEDEEKKIIDGFCYIAAPLHAMPRRFYTDSNIMNFMKDDEIRKIDFENDELLPPFNFFVNVCEFGSDYLDEDAKDGLKHLYWGDEFGMFDNFLPFGAAQRHMEMAGYRSRDIINARKKGGDGQWPLKARGFHLEKAAAYCTRIIENASDYEIYIRKPGLKSIELMVKTIDSVSARPQMMQ